MFHWSHHFKSLLARLPLFSALRVSWSVLPPFALSCQPQLQHFAQLHRDCGRTAGINVRPASVPLETVPVFCLD